MGTHLMSLSFTRDFRTTFLCVSMWPLSLAAVSIKVKQSSVVWYMGLIRSRCSFLEGCCVRMSLRMCVCVCACVSECIARTYLYIIEKCKYIVMYIYICISIYSFIYLCIRLPFVHQALTYWSAFQVPGERHGPRWLLWLTSHAVQGSRLLHPGSGHVPRVCLSISPVFSTRGCGDYEGL